MKITYTPNPLDTQVELEPHEQELLRLKIKLGEYENILFSAHWDLTRTDEYLAGLPCPKTAEQAREGVDVADVMVRRQHRDHRPLHLRLGAALPTQSVRW
jgi:hypothetical protein